MERAQTRQSHGWPGDGRFVTGKRLRVGVIGVGHLGEYHVQKYKAMPDVNLVGVVDTDWRRAQEIALRYGTRPFQAA